MKRFLMVLGLLLITSVYSYSYDNGLGATVSIKNIDAGIIPKALYGDKLLPIINGVEEYLNKSQQLQNNYRAQVFNGNSKINNIKIFVLEFRPDEYLKFRVSDEYTKEITVKVTLSSTKQLVIADDFEEYVIEGMIRFFKNSYDIDKNQATSSVATAIQIATEIDMAIGKMYNNI